MEDTRRGFLKKLLFGGAVLASSSLGLGGKVFSNELKPIEKILSDLNYVFELINAGKKLNEDHNRVLFNYYVEVWNIYYSFEGLNYDGKISALKNYLGSNSFNFVAGLLYMGGDKSKWLDEKGFVLNSEFKGFFNEFVPIKGSGIKVNFLEDMRVFYRSLRHSYYPIKVRMHLNDNIGGLLGDLIAVINGFNNSISEVRFAKYTELLSKGKFSVSMFEKEINDSVLDFIYDKDKSIADNIIVKLLNRVNREDIDVYNENVWDFKQPIIFKIVSSKIDLELKNLIFKYSLKHKIDPILPNLICLLETSYGVGKNVSKGGAKGPLQVMPDAYFDVTGKNNFKTANRSELVEAGILNLIYLMNLFGIQKTKDHYAFVDVFMIGVAYNAGLERLYDLVRVKDYKLHLEPTNYHQFLYFLFTHIIDFE